MPHCVIKLFYSATKISFNFSFISRKNWKHLNKKNACDVFWIGVQLMFAVIFEKYNPQVVMTFIQIRFFKNKDNFETFFWNSKKKMLLSRAKIISIVKCIQVILFCKNGFGWRNPCLSTIFTQLLCACIYRPIRNISWLCSKGLSLTRLSFIKIVMTFGTLLFESFDI